MEGLSLSLSLSLSLYSYTIYIYILSIRCNRALNILIYGRPGDVDLFKEFKKIAYREEKKTSALMKELMAEYVKNHGKGNPNFALEKWNDPEFKAFPTMGEVLRPEALAKWDKTSLLEVAQAARARAQEISQALKRRGESFRWHLGLYD